MTSPLTTTPSTESAEHAAFDVTPSQREQLQRLKASSIPVIDSMFKLLGNTEKTTEVACTD